MIYGLNNSEIEYLKDSNLDIEEAFNKGDLLLIQLEIGSYLTTKDCMYYDEDGQNWYTKKGHYVQSLYDKILDWKYRD